LLGAGGREPYPPPLPSRQARHFRGVGLHLSFVIACRRFRSGNRAKPFPPPSSELEGERIVFVPIRASTNAIQRRRHGAQKRNRPRRGQAAADAGIATYTETSDLQPSAISDAIARNMDLNVRPPLPPSRHRKRSHACRFKPAESRKFIPAPELRLRAPE
jgi:hypothetical protein